MKRLDTDSSPYDVIVVGGGNAAYCAAHAAREQGVRVLMLEKAPRKYRGGNTYFTAGAVRTTHDGVPDLRPILEELSDEQADATDLPPYTRDDFLTDMLRLTEGHCDTELTRMMVDDSLDTVRWLHGKGIRWRLMYDRQSFKVNDKYRFWGGLALGVVGGGSGLIDQHAIAADNAGIEIRYETAVTELVQNDSGAVSGIMCISPNGREEIRADAVILACGGFEADPRLRAMFLGSNWDIAKVRGTPFNTGDGIEMALCIGASPHGHWSGCHSIAWDAAASPTGDWNITNLYSKQSYPIGIVVNRDGKRFLDEGADFRNYTYAKYGAEILKQPGSIAYQLFDAKTSLLLRKDEYNAPGVSRFEANSIDELATQIGVSSKALYHTVSEFNEAVESVEFNPAVKDGKRTNGISPPKSNWAIPLDTPPYLAFAVTCGITFTFGGLKIDMDMRVLDKASVAIPGLFAAGELVGGLFYFNYPGGSGLTSGAVFGRRAGYSAASKVRNVDMSHYR